MSQLKLLPVFLLLLLALPAEATSKSYILQQDWSNAGCSGDTTLIENKHQGKTWADGTCVLRKISGSTGYSGATEYTKATCAAPGNAVTAEYSDNACTTSSGSVWTHAADTCSTTDNTKYTCATTSATVGGLTYQYYGAAGCAASEQTDAGLMLANMCERKQTNGADPQSWIKSTKLVIEGGKLKQYEWTASASQNRDCSGTGTASTESNGDATEYTTGDTCTQMPGSTSRWYKLSNMIDGASISGYSTLPGNTAAPTSAGTNTATTAASSVLLGVVCTLLSLMFC